MLWFILAVVGLGSGAAYLAHEAEQHSTRTPPKLGEGDPPAHGRTAFLNFKGMPKWLDVMGKISQTVSKAMVTYFTGGTGGALWTAAQDKLMSATKGLHGKEWATWINNASNEEVAGLRLAQLRKVVKKDREKQTKMVAVWDRLGLTDELLAGPPLEALPAALRADLLHYGMNPWVPLQQNLHGLQAMAILLYGGTAVLPALDAGLKVKPKVKTDTKDPGLTTLLAWADGLLADLAAARGAAFGAEADESAALRAESLAAVVGAEPPADSVEKLVEFLVDRLTRNDAAPVDYQLETTGPTTKQLTLRFYTGFRKQHADELLFASYRARPDVVRVLTKVIEA
jgi:hypothetical protein